MTGLVKKVDAYAKENKKADVRAVVILLGKEDEANKAKLKKIAEDEKIEVPLTIDKGGAIKTLKLDENVKDTVMVYRKKKVTANFALNGLTDKDADAVLAALKEAVAEADKEAAEKKKAS